MGRLDDIFAGLRANQRRALMPFVCGGFPRPGQTAAMIRACEAGGASVVEVGIPFSDPIADGPVIAAAMHEALTKGATPAAVFEEVRAFRDASAGESGENVRDPMVREMLGAGRTPVGLVAMISISIVHRLGGEGGFAKRAKAAGFDGIIVPDLPLEESAALRAAAADEGLSMSLLIAPSTPPARAAEIAKASTGFLYVLARAGLTGERSDAPEIGGMVTRLREMTPLPIAVGFGISTPEHVRAVVRHADAAIVGSALVRRVGEAHKAGREAAMEAKSFTASLAGGLAVEGLSVDGGRSPR